MSEIVNVEVVKENEKQVSVIVRSFRDDALPNPDLQEEEDIATTGFVLFCDIAFYRYDKKGQKLLAELYQELKELYKGNFYGFERYPRPEVAKHFIATAKIVELRREEGDDYYYDIDDWVEKYNLTDKQRTQLYDLMEFEEGDYELEENFSVYLFRDGVRDVIGKKNYAALQPLIHFQLTFQNPKHIEKLHKLSADTTLDSYIKSWMPKE